MKAKIAAFGQKDIMLIFKAIGVDVFSVDEDLELKAQLEKLIKEGYAIIFITEDIAFKIPETIKKYMNKTLPSIVIIPSPGENKNFAVDLLRQAVVKAMGVDLFLEN